MPFTISCPLFEYSNKKICRFICTSKVLDNYYNILNLSRSCSSKEIRESFLKLSKENHPDVNKEEGAHKKFLQINEAYNVLSKAETRKIYDLSLEPLEGSSSRNEIRVPYKEQFGKEYGVLIILPLDSFSVV